MSDTKSALYLDGDGFAGGNDLPKIVAAQSRIAPGSAVRVSVRHDEWCRRLAAIGKCNCDPYVDVAELKFGEIPK